MELTEKIVAEVERTGLESLVPLSRVNRELRESVLGLRPWTRLEGGVVNWNEIASSVFGGTVGQGFVRTPHDDRLTRAS